MDAVEKLIERLRDELPAVWERIATDRLTGGVIKSRTLANLMSLGKYTGESFRIGRRCVIERDSFLKWLEIELKKGARSKVKSLQPGTVK